MCVCRINRGCDSVVNGPDPMHTSYRARGPDWLCGIFMALFLKFIDPLPFHSHCRALILGDMYIHNIYTCIYMCVCVCID